MKRWIKKNRLWLGGCFLLIASAIVVLLLWDPDVNAGKPTLTIETPRRKSASHREDFTLDVGISDLGDVLYPAMSMSVSFDPSRLEFLGIEEGNVFILSDESPTGRQLPQWSCNVENSNATGLINVMYLDMTGGRNAFSETLLEEDGNVLLRFRFRLRGSVREGDVLDIAVEDGVFAATDEGRSLAMTTETLAVKNGKIVIGE